jgi:tRNA(Arg) A34 adenosine deaminase TadA
MAKMTKTQKKRMISEIQKKSKKLYMDAAEYPFNAVIVSTKDMEAIEKLCAKWMKRIG